MNTKKLKPFDLEAALNGDPVMLRNGSKAFIRHYESEIDIGSKYTLLGVIEGTSCYQAWTKEGYFADGLVGGKDIIGMYPKTRIINGFEVPAPETVEPKIGEVCFHANVSLDIFHYRYVWKGSRCELLALKRGLVFLTKEDAIANAKAMLGINPYEKQEN